MELNRLSLTPVPHHANGRPIPRHPWGHSPPMPHPPHRISTSTHAHMVSGGQLPYQDAVTSGDWCGTEIIQCAAITQDTQQVSTSISHRMSSVCKVASELPTSSPFWSKSYADFVMEKELEETEAAVEECYRRRAGRAGLSGMLPAGRPMTEGKLDTLSEALGDGTRNRAKRRRQIEEMTIEDMEAEIRETNAVIRKRRRASRGLLPMPLALLMCLLVTPVEGFTVYDCSNRSNMVESYSLLEPDACANMGRDGEVETTVYGEIVQIKQDRMIPVFRCVVVKTLVAQYCGMFLTAGVTRYIRFRELKPLEAWECRKARRSGQILINGRTVKGKIGATASHSMFLSGSLDDDSRCEEGMVTLPDGKVLNGLAAQGLYEITLREEFARLKNTYLHSSAPYALCWNKRKPRPPRLLVRRNIEIDSRPNFRPARR
jgi:hypothetical protein